MTFEDLTTWDLDLIRSNGIHALSFTKIQTRYQAVAQSTLACIRAKGFNIQSEPKNLQLILSDWLVPKHAYSSAGREPTFEELVKEVFSYLRVNGLELVKDESRNSTWSTRKKSWYAEEAGPKKPWVF